MHRRTGRTRRARRCRARARQWAAKTKKVCRLAVAAPARNARQRGLWPPHLPPPPTRGGGDRRPAAGRAPPPRACPSCSGHAQSHRRVRGLHGRRPKSRSMLGARRPMTRSLAATAARPSVTASRPSPAARWRLWPSRTCVAHSVEPRARGPATPAGRGAAAVAGARAERRRGYREPASTRCGAAATGKSGGAAAAAQRRHLAAPGVLCAGARAEELDWRGASSRSHAPRVARVGRDAAPEATRASHCRAVNVRLRSWRCARGGFGTRLCAVSSR